MSFIQKNNAIYPLLFSTFFNKSPKLLSIFLMPKKVHNCFFTLKTHSVINLS